MTKGFQVHFDARGDLWGCDGTVIERATGNFFPVGAGDPDGAGLVGEPAANLGVTAELPSVTDMTFLGGSGGNVIVTGLAALSGFYRPYRPNQYRMGVFLMEVTGSSAATISDETDVVAELTSGGTAPAGSFVATTYGEDTYNSSSAFTLTGTKEVGWPGGYADLDVTVDKGTAQRGRYTTTDGVTFTSVVDTDWTIVLAADGSAEMIHDGTTVAARAVGNADDPCGHYDSTTDGEYLNPEPLADDASVPLDVNPFGTLTLDFTWSGSLDLDIGVVFLDTTVGFGYSAGSGYMTWSGDVTGSSGLETVVVDLATAWDDGAISTFADILALADWYTPHAGSGPATLTVTYDPPGGSGTPVVHTIHPLLNTPALTTALGLRVGQAGSVTLLAAPWTMSVRAVRRAPRAGVAWIEVTESGGITGVTGPFFEAAMPSPGGGMTPFPLATSDGAGKLKQLHTGPLVW